MSRYFRHDDQYGHWPNGNGSGRGYGYNRVGDGYGHGDYNYSSESGDGVGLGHLSGGGYGDGDLPSVTLAPLTSSDPDDWVCWDSEQELNKEPGA